MQKNIICLMGPTASGKTPLAIEIVKNYPCEIISVDSAMVYRDMNIGTAKPDAATLKAIPHRLVDCCDPAEIYSAGHFRADALREINAVHAAGKTPLLVGGTMMYFRILLTGLAALPRADQSIRQALTKRAEGEGTEALHAELAAVDPVSAARIHSNDLQRIQRALEVFILTKKPISTWQETDTSALAGFNITQIALMPASRELLHERIAARFKQMLTLGLVDEVRALYERDDINLTLPSMRSVGYRQVWDYIAGNIDANNMQETAIAATRQLAKRQITWLRTWPNCQLIESESPDLWQQVVENMPNLSGRK